MSFFIMIPLVEPVSFSHSPQPMASVVFLGLVHPETYRPLPTDGLSDRGTRLDDLLVCRKGKTLEIKCE